MFLPIHHRFVLFDCFAFVPFALLQLLAFTLLGCLVLFQLLHDPAALVDQLLEGIRPADVAVPLGVLVGDERQLLAAQVAQDALLAEGVVAVVAAYQLPTFSAPSVHGGRHRAQ